MVITAMRRTTPAPPLDRLWRGAPGRGGAIRPRSKGLRAEAAVGRDQSGWTGTAAMGSAGCEPGTPVGVGTPVAVGAGGSGGGCCGGASAGAASGAAASAEGALGSCSAGSNGSSLRAAATVSCSILMSGVMGNGGRCGTSDQLSRPDSSGGSVPSTPNKASGRGWLTLPWCHARVGQAEVLARRVPVRGAAGPLARFSASSSAARSSVSASTLSPLRSEALTPSPSVT